MQFRTSLCNQTLARAPSSLGNSSLFIRDQTTESLLENSNFLKFNAHVQIKWHVIEKRETVNKLGEFLLLIDEAPLVLKTPNCRRQKVRPSVLLVHELIARTYVFWIH